MKVIIEAFLLPPGLFVAIGLLSLALMHRTSGRILVLVNLAALYFLSIPVVGTQLMSSLEVTDAVSAAEIQAFAPQAIVVPLSSRYPQAPEYGGPTLGAQSLERLRYAAYLHRRTQLPLLLTGGAMGEPGPALATLAREMMETEFKLPVARVETASNSTEDNAQLSRPLLQAMGAERILLVTHGWHMKRASERFRAEGFEVLPAPTAINLPVLDPGAGRNWIPRLWALSLSYNGMHERMGQLWYKLNTLFG